MRRPWPSKHCQTLIRSEWIYHARMARRAQHLCYVRESNERTTSWITNGFKNKIAGGCARRTIDDTCAHVLPNVVRPCCREAAALRGARHAKRGAAGHNVRQPMLWSPFSFARESRKKRGTITNHNIGATIPNLTTCMAYHARMAQDDGPLRAASLN